MITADYVAKVTADLATANDAYNDPRPSWCAMRRTTAAAAMYLIQDLWAEVAAKEEATRSALAAVAVARVHYKNDAFIQDLCDYIVR